MGASRRRGQRKEALPGGCMSREARATGGPEQGPSRGRPHVPIKCGTRVRIRRRARRRYGRRGPTSCPWPVKVPAGGRVYHVVRCARRGQELLRSRSRVGVAGQDAPPRLGRGSLVLAPRRTPDQLPSAGRTPPSARAARAQPPPHHPSRCPGLGGWSASPAACHRVTSTRLVLRTGAGLASARVLDAAWWAGMSGLMRRLAMRALSSPDQPLGVADRSPERV